MNTDEYISEQLVLNRSTFAIIRRAILRQSKKRVAYCSGISESTYKRVEKMSAKIRKETYVKVLDYFKSALEVRGWKEIKNNVQ